MAIDKKLLRARRPNIEAIAIVGTVELGNQEGIGGMNAMAERTRLLKAITAKVALCIKLGEIGEWESWVPSSR